MRVLLDTQVFVVLATEGLPAIPRRTQKLLADPDTERVLSAMSLSEVAIKTSIGKLALGPERVSLALDDMSIDVLSFTQRHSRFLYDLPFHHREPFDRMIIATALSEDIPLIGGDECFPPYKAQGLSVIWK